MNWKTTLSGVSVAISTAITILAGLPYQLGELGEVIPPDWKPAVVKIGLVCMILSKIWNGVVSADAKVGKGGNAAGKIAGIIVVGGYLGFGSLFLSSCTTPTLRVPVGKWVTIAGRGVFWLEAGFGELAEKPMWPLARPTKSSGLSK